MIDSYCADFPLAGADGNKENAPLLTERADPAPIYNFLCGVLGGERGWQFNAMHSHYILVLFFILPVVYLIIAYHTYKNIFLPITRL